MRSEEKWERKESHGRDPVIFRDFLPRDPAGILERDVARMNRQDVWNDDFD